jgi:Family of unknown function (DUF6502)
MARTMIRGELGVGTFVHAAKLAYLRAAIEEVVSQPPRTNVSRLSVVTGMTRKEVSLLLAYIKGNKNNAWPGRSKEQRALRVLYGWRSDPEFQTHAHRPADLELRRGRNSFASLVRSYAGDVTPISVLRELERIRAVVRTRAGKLRVRPTRRTREATHQLTHFARLVSDFAQTASKVSAEPTSSFLTFRDLYVETPSQSARFRRTFSRRARSLLAGVEQWRNRHPGSDFRKAPNRKVTACRVGVGVYLVQDPTLSVPRRGIRHTRLR